MPNHKRGPAQRETCDKGHPMTGDNLLIVTHRQCRECRRLRSQAYNRRHTKAAQEARNGD